MELHGQCCILAWSVSPWRLCPNPMLHSLSRFSFSFRSSPRHPPGHRPSHAPILFSHPPSPVCLLRFTLTTSVLPSRPCESYSRLGAPVTLRRRRRFPPYMVCTVVASRPYHSPHIYSMIRRIHILSTSYPMRGPSNLNFQLILWFVVLLDFSYARKVRQISKELI